MQYKRRHEYHQDRHNFCESFSTLVGMVLLMFFIFYNINWSSLKGSGLSLPTVIGPPSGSRY